MNMLQSTLDISYTLVSSSYGMHLYLHLVNTLNIATRVPIAGQIFILMIYSHTSRLNKTCVCTYLRGFHFVSTTSLFYKISENTTILSFIQLHLKLQP
jgi:hypothetical protein